MAKLKFIVDGGKATANPAMAQTIGPMKINLNEVLQNINKKTEAFAGLKVPVEIAINEKTKEYNIEVGSPPSGELIKKEIGIPKGGGTPNKIKVGNISVEQLIKIASMKKDNMFTTDIKSAIKTVAGTCNSLGILIEGKTSTEFNSELDSGKYDREIKEGKTEATPDKLKKLQQQLVEVQSRLDSVWKKKAEEEAAKAAVVAPAPEAKEGEKKEELKKAEGKEVKKTEEKKVEKKK